MVTNDQLQIQYYHETSPSTMGPLGSQVRCFGLPLDSQTSAFPLSLNLPPTPMFDNNKQSRRIIHLYYKICRDHGGRLPVSGEKFRDWPSNQPIVNHLWRLIHPVLDPPYYYQCVNLRGICFFSLFKKKTTRVTCVERRPERFCSNFI